MWSRCDHPGCETARRPSRPHPRRPVPPTLGSVQGPVSPGKRAVLGIEVGCGGGNGTGLAKSVASPGPKGGHGEPSSFPEPAWKKASVGSTSGRPGSIARMIIRRPDRVFDRGANVASPASDPAARIASFSGAIPRRWPYILASWGIRSRPDRRRWPRWRASHEILSPGMKACRSAAIRPRFRSLGCSAPEIADAEDSTSHPAPPASKGLDHL